MVPYDIYEEMGEEALKSENLVQIPYYEYKNNPKYFVEHKTKKRNYILCKYHYAYEKGFDGKNPQGTSEQNVI